MFRYINTFGVRRLDTHFRDKTVADKFIYIPNDDTENYPFCRLQLETCSYQLYEPTNQNSIKVLNVVRPTNKKTLL